MLQLNGQLLIFSENFVSKFFSNFHNSNFIPNFGIKNNCFAKAVEAPKKNYAMGRTIAVMLGIVLFGVLLPVSNGHPFPNCNKCAKSYRICLDDTQECGACLNGFEELSDQSCHYIWNVTHNSNASIIEGNSVILTCFFDEPVDCFWITNDNFADFNGHVSYLNSNGENTHDCSIQIRRYSNADKGKWSCSSTGTSSSRGKVGSINWLKTANTTNEAESLVPEITTQQLKDFGSLLKLKSASEGHKEEQLCFQCSVKSILPVKLQWTVNGNRMEANLALQVKQNTTIILQLPMPNENSKESTSFNLTCLAEYLNINQSFSDEVTLTLERSHTDTNNDPNDELLRTFFIVMCGMLSLAICSWMTYLAFRLYKYIHKPRTQTNISDEENPIIKKEELQNMENRTEDQNSENDKEDQSSNNDEKNCMSKTPSLKTPLLKQDKYHTSRSRISTEDQNSNNDKEVQNRRNDKDQSSKNDEKRMMKRRSKSLTL